MSINLTSVIGDALRHFVAASASLQLLLNSPGPLTRAKKKRIRRALRRWRRAFEALSLDEDEYKSAVSLIRYCQAEALNSPQLTAREARRGSLRVCQIIRVRYGITAAIHEPATSGTSTRQPSESHLSHNTTR